jgi:sugar-specific transcriptional regulator TrmB
MKVMGTMRVDADQGFLDSNATKILRNLGLTSNQIRLYSIALRQGSVTVGELARKSGIHRANAYKIVDHLKALGLIELILGSVNKVKAVDLGEAIDLMVARKEEILGAIRNYRLGFVTDSTHQTIEESIAEPNPSKIFAHLIIGRHTYALMERLIQGSSSEILWVTSSRGFLLQSNFGMTELMADKARRDRVSVKILTQPTEYGYQSLKDLSEVVEIRCHKGVDKTLRYMIADKKELVLKMAAPPKFLDQSVALWSNSRDLIQGLSLEFGRVWSKAARLNR